jgi:hypothetical protein
MQWATSEDFDGKIAMFKWARAADRENPSWVFSYGNEPLDAGLVIAAAVAEQTCPFESKTPEMTESVGSDFRASWFSFIHAHADALLRTPRRAQVGVWYSAPSRDFHDYAVGGSYGMYVTTKPPTQDPDWWADNQDDSALPKPHLGGWRAAAHALIQLGIPFKAILDPGEPAAELSGLPLVWLPSVVAISDASIAVLEEYVRGGGILFATGAVPAQLDELGNARAQNGLAALFGDPAPKAVMATKPYGSGQLVYHPEIQATDLYGLIGDPIKAAQSLEAIRKIVKSAVTPEVTVDFSPGILVEEARPSDTTAYLYAVNYTGLWLPAAPSPMDVSIRFAPPAGTHVARAESASPDTDTQQGALSVTTDQGAAVIALHIDQFSLITLALAKD